MSRQTLKNKTNECELTISDDKVYYKTLIIKKV